jgi:hypothetical protein
VSKLFGVEEGILLTRWNERSPQVGLVLDAFIKAKSSDPDGFQIRLDWNMYDAKRVGGRPTGRTATYQDLQIAASIVKSFIRNAKKARWP